MTAIFTDSLEHKFTWALAKGLQGLHNINSLQIFHIDLPKYDLHVSIISSIVKIKGISYGLKVYFIYPKC